MASWSAENATKAYLRTLKMRKRGKEPDAAEFISALAAGNNAQLMVLASADVAGPTALALVAAARQTSGRVVCILGASEKVDASRKYLGYYADCLQFIIGDAKTLLASDEYKVADFVLIDCNIKCHRDLFEVVKVGMENSSGLNGDYKIVVGYNAMNNKGSLAGEKYDETQFLPIGDGLLVTRIRTAAPGRNRVGGGGGWKRRSRWVVKVDKWTGEEHVFRVTSPLHQQIEA